MRRPPLLAAAVRAVGAGVGAAHLDLQAERFDLQLLLLHLLHRPLELCLYVALGVHEVSLDPLVLRVRHRHRRRGALEGH